jgi:N-methylhydantoinase A
MADADARLAVDIGGTFTDVVVEQGGRRTTTKLLTTQDAPERAVVDGVRQVLAAAHLTPDRLALVIHGTTLATNALIERKGALTALVATQGFRDSVEMAYEHRFEQYDIQIEKPPPLVPRHLRYTVPERVNARGEVLLALDEAAVDALAAILAQREIASVAIGFLHSYANPDHERRARDRLARRLPELSITLSADVCPEIREYDRLSTACANAYIQPLMAGYLGALERQLKAMGIACPLFMMLSGGGITTLETAARNPIRLVESGPAGGAILASHIAAECGLPRLLSFDMGGTTAKICLIDDYEPQGSRSFEVARVYRFLKGSGLPLRIPVIEMVEIGAGGGSIARVDSLLRIAVGPDSAGAEPGPACYGRGGAAPTVTDADLLLGRIDPTEFAGGRVTLDAPRAGAALAHGVGTPLGLAPALAALGVSEMVDENMANAARVHAIERGKNVADRTLVAFGGAAPLHAARLAEKLGIARIIVPTSAGVGSAVGFLRAPVAYEVVRSRYQRLDRFDAVALNRMFAEMRAEAFGVVEQGAPAARFTEQRSAFMRYVGQGHEITVTVPARDLTAADAVSLQQAFDDSYRALYGRIIPRLQVEALSWTLRVASAVERPTALDEASPRSDAAPDGRRQLFEPARAGFVEVPVYRRAHLVPGARLRGPALITEDETTIVVTGGFTASVNRLGYVVMERISPLPPGEG